ARDPRNERCGDVGERRRDSRSEGGDRRRWNRVRTGERGERGRRSETAVGRHHRERRARRVGADGAPAQGSRRRRRVSRRSPDGSPARQSADRDRGASVGGRAGVARLTEPATLRQARRAEKCGGEAASSRRDVKNCRGRPALPLSSTSPALLLMRSRLIVPALLLAFSVPLGAQGRGGRGGPDNRPEVTFPVDLPVDDAKLAAMKKEAI